MFNAFAAGFCAAAALVCVLEKRWDFVVINTILILINLIVCFSKKRTEE